MDLVQTYFCRSVIPWNHKFIKFDLESPHEILKQIAVFPHQFKSDSFVQHLGQELLWIVIVLKETNCHFCFQLRNFNQVNCIRDLVELTVQNFPVLNYSKFVEPNLHWGWSLNSTLASHYFFELFLLS